jgi:hypothetical protein
VVGLAVGLAIAALAYRWLYSGHLEQTSALFIGLPALLAIALTLTPRAKSATGMVLKGMTIGLLLSGVVLGEGFICILFAAPIFYAVGIVVGLVVDHARRSDEGRIRAYILLALPLGLMSLEGVTPATTFPQEQEVSVKSTVKGTPADVEHALARPTSFDRPLPIFLQIGFPRPVATSGSGLETGDERVVVFRGKDGSPRAMIFQVAEHDPGRVRFVVVADTSPIAEWLGWRDSVVTWHDAGPGRTEVAWTVHYQRRLSPAWYFGPAESLALQAAAGYLIDCLATPR